jgi:hypothetical protein
MVRTLSKSIPTASVAVVTALPAAVAALDATVETASVTVPTTPAAPFERRLKKVGSSGAASALGAGAGAKPIHSSDGPVCVAFGFLAPIAMMSLIFFLARYLASVVRCSAFSTSVCLIW